MLLFKKKFIDLIRSGEKTQTIRLWKCCRMKQGQRSYIPGIGYILITRVEPIELENLKDADAVLDGFPSADALRAEICTLYAEDVRKKRRPFMIRFSVYSPSEQQRIAEEQHENRERKAILKSSYRYFSFGV